MKKKVKRPTEEKGPVSLHYCSLKHYFRCRYQRRFLPRAATK